MPVSFVFILLVLVSQVVIAPFESFQKISILWLSIGLGYMASQLRGRAWGLLATVTFMLQIIVLAVGFFYVQWLKKVSILQPWINWSISVRPDFLPGDLIFVHSNEFAGIQILSIPFGFVLLFAGLSGLARPNRRQKLLGGLAVLGGIIWLTLMLPLLVLTQSRGAWVGCAGAVLCLVLGWGSRLRWAALIVVLLLVVGVYFGRNHPAVATQLQALQGLSETKTVAQALNPSSLTYRLRLWSNALLMVQDFGFTGTGLDQFRRLVPTLPLYYSFGNEDVAHAHNMLLHTAVELGIPGLVVYLALLVQLVIAARQALHPARTRLWQRSAAWGLAGGLLAHFVFGLTDAVALGALPGVFWWAQAGLLLALASNVATREQSRHGAAALGWSASAKPAQ